MQKVRKAVFPVAGLGTRFLPATKAMPKEMLTLVDKPLIQYAVEEARAAGIEEFIFVTSKGKDPLEDHFDMHSDLYRTLEARGKTAELEALKKTEIPSGQLFFTRQREPLGLGHAVWCARAALGNEPFAVLLPDVVVLSNTPCLEQMVGAYKSVGGNMLAVEDVPREDTNKYGILDVASENGKLAVVKGLVEKPKPEAAPSTLSIIGRYILQPEILTLLDNNVQKNARGAGGEIQLTDALVGLLGKQPFHGFRFEGKTYDCGDKVGFIEANVAFALSRPDLKADVAKKLKTLV
ncbi:MAG: UTP--glucose-1-phosphate uridylyltransferase GalU [Alphaproteobacteria bacterium]|nr:UTP--glucose-1-phosphate uridylyltransferase GalU [Alphaproteobacteria bacterium]